MGKMPESSKLPNNNMNNRINNNINNKNLVAAGHRQTSFDELDIDLDILAQTSDYERTPSSPPSFNNQQSQYSFQQSNPPSGGIDLKKQVPTAYVGLIFVMLTWRALGNYEMADQFSSGILRLLCVVPSIALLIMNLVGFIINMLKPNSYKSSLKFILALNIIREWIEMAYNVIRMVTAKNVSREVYFGRFFMNVWWSVFCMAYSKSRWVTQLAMNIEREKDRAKYPNSAN